MIGPRVSSNSLWTTDLASPRLQVGQLATVVGDDQMILLRAALVAFGLLFAAASNSPSAPVAGSAQDHSTHATSPPRHVNVCSWGIGACNNWAGYTVNTGGKARITNAYGSFVIPNIDCSAGTTTVASWWVGIDGGTSGNSTVEQAGIDGVCSAGKAAYWPWWESFPKDPVTWTQATDPATGLNISPKLNPGDTVYVVVTESPIGTFQYYMEVAPCSTSCPMGAHPEEVFQATDSVPGTRGTTAECIVEQPGSQQYPLTKFATVTMRLCEASTATNSYPMVGAVKSPYGLPSGWTRTKSEIQNGIPKKNLTSTSGPLTDYTGNPDPKFTVAWLKY
jgi:Peptidase A4 family